MRIAVVPCITHTHYATESEVIQYTRFARTTWKHHKVVTYMLIPRDMNDDALIKDEPPYLYNIKSWNWQRFHVAMGCLPDNFSKLLNTGLPYLYADMVLTTRTGIAGYIQRLLWSGKGMYVPVFIQEQMSADYSSPMVTSIDDIDLTARACSYALCKPLFATEVEKRIALNSCRRYLNASLCKKIQDKAPVFAPGISFKAVKEAVKFSKGKKNRSFTVFFGGRLNIMKRAKQLVETYDKFYSSGRPIRVVITTPINLPGFKIPPEIEVYDSLNTEQFLKKCCKAHVLLASSRIEGFTAGLHEMMATGIVTILPKLKWAKVLLKDKWADYPFKYNTFTEAYQVLVWIYEHYKEACEKVAWVPKWLEDNVVEELCSLKIYDWMEKEVAESWPPVLMGSVDRPNSNAQLVLDTINNFKSDKFTLKDVLYAITASDKNHYTESNWSKQFRGRMSAWMVFRYISGHPDFEDCGGLQPVFKRLHKPKTDRRR